MEGGEKEMEIEEGIEFLESIKPGKVQEYDTIEGLNIRYERNLDEVQQLLRESEKYKLMDRALRDKLIYIEQVNYPPKKYTYEDIKAVMDEVRRRYFPPKILTKTVTIRMEADSTDELAGGLKGISGFVSSAQIPKMQVINIGKMKEEG